MNFTLMDENELTPAFFCAAQDMLKNAGKNKWQIRPFKLNIRWIHAYNTVKYRHPNMWLMFKKSKCTFL